MDGKLDKVSYKADAQWSCNIQHNLLEHYGQTDSQSEIRFVMRLFLKSNHLSYLTAEKKIYLIKVSCSRIQIARWTKIVLRIMPMYL